MHIQDNATANTIGGTVAGAGNVIDFNGGAGVAVTDNAQFNPILTNSIYSNGDLGINLSGNGNENLQAAGALLRGQQEWVHDHRRLAHRLRRQYRLPAPVLLQQDRRSLGLR